MSKEQLVRQRDDGKWEVFGKGNVKASHVCDTQKEAIDYAKTIARNQEAKLKIHGVDGKVRDSVKYSKDEKKKDSKTKKKSR